MWECPNCGALNPDDTDICEECWCHPDDNMGWIGENCG